MSSPPWLASALTKSSFLGYLEKVADAPTSTVVIFLFGIVLFSLAVGIAVAHMSTWLTGEPFIEPNHKNGETSTDHAG